MKKKNERNAIPEETKNELKPETESCVKLTDEQMEQVSGGAGPKVKRGIEYETLVVHDNLDTVVE